ncbi:MAG: FAD-dependent oxidoreductase [Dehalococcoidales bacterium]|nr:FAD-dependent oxidoreductase [Dehalococcoidales bacterium]
MSNANMKYKSLLSPGRIGSMELKNRIVLAPMGTYLAGRDGLVTDRLKAYYAARAGGGVGLVIAGVAAVDYPRGRVMTRQIGISEDKFIPGLSELAEAVHKNGARLGIQLQHGGRIAAPFLSGGHEPVSASVVPLVPAELGLTRELTVPEIEQIVQRFAEAAKRAKAAGIDGVEIHAGHGYLINQFLSRSNNKRLDEYGGSLPGRARFLLEIIREVRKAVGVQYPLWCRLDGQEFSIVDGITREEALETADMIENAGVDAIHVTGYGGSAGYHFTEAPLVNAPDYLIPLARGIKGHVKIPVIAVGRIDLDTAEQLLRRGEADFIAMGRALLADFELPHKIAEGSEEDIRRCIYCYSCVHQIFVRGNICCSVNALVGKESEPAPALPEKKKWVVVVGGGPAGLEAARTAALRGHRVILYEKERFLGGSLRFASVVRRENEDLIKFLTGQLRRLKVEIKCGEPVTPETIDRIRPDALILATGAVRHLPAIPGISSAHVIDGDDLRQLLGGNTGGKAARKLNIGQKLMILLGSRLFGSLASPGTVRRLSGIWMPLGKRVAVMGGGMVGCELAVFLAERGRKVTVLETADQVAPEMSLPLRWITLEKMERNQVTVLTEVKYEEVVPRGVNILLKDGSRQTVHADTVILAVGSEPEKDLLKAYEGKAPEVYLAGDCGKLSYIKDSVAEGNRLGNTV